MIEIQITGIRKDNGNHNNPHEAVEYYRWYEPASKKQAITDRKTVVSWLDNGLGGHQVRAYVQQIQPRAYCYVNESRYGTRFLQTRSDSTPSNNLLNLPEC